MSNRNLVSSQVLISSMISMTYAIAK